MKWETVVGANLKRLRMARGLTQERLAKAAKVDLRYLGSIERGDGNPSLKMLTSLAAALKVHPAELLKEQ